VRLALALLLVSAPAWAGDKLALLEEKRAAAPPTAAARARLDRALAKRVGKPPAPVVNLWNLWTREALVLDAGLDAETFGAFLRCHFTGDPAQMDMRLLEVLVGAAKRFQAARIDVVSGYRSPKYNLVLRKKGREVARDSQHIYGHAVDFRVRGVPTEAVVGYVRSLRVGGVGVYRESGFVHADTGPVRTWAGR
jgi:hypothetical protein